MRLSVCIDIMMRDLPVADRIRNVKKAGLPAIEFWGWEDKDISEIESTAEECQIEIAAFCTRFVSLVDPTLRPEFIEGLKVTLPTAQRLNCRKLITQTGVERAGVEREEQIESLITGLRACAPILEDNGITLLVEPLNTIFDHKGYFLSKAEEAFYVIREVNSPFIKVLYDVYHQQITDGNLIPTIQQNIDSIGHFHIADHPGRNQPGIGEINYSNVLKAIADTGYTGHIGLEFVPTIPAIGALTEVNSLVTGVVSNS